VSCHFDPFGKAQDGLREKSFLDPSHSLGVTDLAPYFAFLASPRLGSGHTWRDKENESLCLRKFAQVAKTINYNYTNVAKAKGFSGNAKEATGRLPLAAPSCKK
jgi:hypothetical protein